MFKHLHSDKTYRNIFSISHDHWLSFLWPSGSDLVGDDQTETELNLVVSEQIKM